MPADDPIDETSKTASISYRVSEMRRKGHIEKTLESAVVIDVESTCWDGGRPRGAIPEIIEIGVCLVDLKTLVRSKKRSILVKPLRSKVSEYCTALTGITQSIVEHEPPLKSALKILKNEYRVHERLFVSWGDYDRRQFYRNCEEYELPYPFGSTHLNLRHLWSTVMGLSSEITLDDACAELGLPWEGQHHRGIDDAWNTAALYIHMMKRMRCE
ncbi:MAG: exonuclease domain-containing protein [bacterium]|nr:exonuclease domain-containing protein [bacterium]